MVSTAYCTAFRVSIYLCIIYLLFIILQRRNHLMMNENVLRACRPVWRLKSLVSTVIQNFLLVNMKGWQLLTRTQPGLGWPVLFSGCVSVGISDLFNKWVGFQLSWFVLCLLARLNLATWTMSPCEPNPNPTC